MTTKKKPGRSTPPKQDKAKKRIAREDNAIAQAPDARMRAASLATRVVNELAECAHCGAGLGKPCTDGEAPLRDDLAHNVRIEAAEKAQRSGLPATSKPVDLAGIRAPAKLELLDPAKIELNPHNPRRAPADDEAQKSFEDSIATNGVLEPILVRPNVPAAIKAGREPYQLVAGERRFKAALKAIAAKRLPKDYRIPATVKALDNRQALIVALTENLARADMHPLDESEAFAKLADNGVGTAEIAAAVNRTQRLVQQRIKVAKDLPEEGKAAMREPRKLTMYGHKGELWRLSFSQAFAIASVADAKIKARVLKDVLEDYHPPRCGEDWIKRRVDSLERQRKQREADKRNPKAAARRKAERAAIHGTREQPRKIEYPAPDAAGVYAWPAKKRSGALYHEEVEHRGEHLVIAVRGVAIGKDGDYNHRWIAGYAVSDRTGAGVSAEPLTEKTGAGVLWKMTAPAYQRAIEHLLAHPPAPPAPHARAWFRDMTVAIGEIRDDKAAKRLLAEFDALQARLFPPAVPSSTGATASAVAARQAARAAAPNIATPDKSEPLAQRLEIPTAPNLGPDAQPMTTAGLALIAAAASKRSRSAVAEREGLPDVVVVAKGGRSFFFTFLYEVPAETKKAA